MIDVTQETRKDILQSKEFDFKVPQKDGVLVVRVIPRSPAEKSGLQPGDIISKVGNVAVKTSLQVQEQVDLSTIDSVLSVEVLRNNNLKILKVIPSAFPKSEFK